MKLDKRNIKDCILGCIFVFISLYVELEGGVDKKGKKLYILRN